MIVPLGLEHLIDAYSINPNMALWAFNEYDLPASTVGGIMLAHNGVKGQVVEDALAAEAARRAAAEPPHTTDSGQCSGLADADRRPTESAHGAKRQSTGPSTSVSSLVACHSFHMHLLMQSSSARLRNTTSKPTGH